MSNYNTSLSLTNNFGTTGGTDANSSSTIALVPASAPNFGGSEGERKVADNHDVGDLHERDILPELIETDINTVVTWSTISKLPPNQQGDAIVAEFNKGLKEHSITTTVNCFRGNRIDRGQFMVAHHNFIPEIRPYCPNKLAVCYSWFKPNTVIEQIGVYNQNDPFYGGHGVWVVNVPLGKYSKVWHGQIPKLLGPGCHVIHDNTFRLDTTPQNSSPSASFVNISEAQIQHGTIHILRIPVGQIAKVWMGTTPNLLYARGDGRPYVVNDPLFKVDGVCNQIDSYIGHGTIHILRIDAGKFAKVWDGNQAKLLPSRKDPYVFHSPNFRFNPVDVCSQLEPYINHGNMHVIRVPSGFLCKVWLGTTPLILESRENPYTYDDPLFRLDNPLPAGRFVSQLSPYVRHGTIHRLRVPSGLLAEIWEGNTPRILESQEAAYEFNSPYFKLNPFVPGTAGENGTPVSSNAEDLYQNASAPYINHGVIHIIRVPSGKVAKVWDGSSAKLLEYKPSAYVYNSPVFRFERVSDHELFENANKQLIVHGSLKRIIPRTGEIALVYDNGTLKVTHSSSDAKPIIIDSETCYVDGFLSTGIQTLTFPSEETKAIRRKESKNVTEDQLNYEIFTTKDSLQIGVKLMVAYKIVNPERAVTLLKKDGINMHIEQCSVVDMGKCIQSCSSKDFLASNQTKATTKVGGEIGSAGDEQKENPGGSKESITQYIQDTVKNAFKDDLAEYGIELVRLNFETPKILDAGLAKQMQDQALNIANVSAKEAVMEQNTRIAKTQADQEATVSRIKQEQVNANILSIARTEQEAAQMKATQEANVKRIQQDQANSIIVSIAKAEQDAAQMRATAILVEAEARIKATKLQGEQYTEHPGLLQVKLAEISSTTITSALHDAKVQIVCAPDNVSSSLASFANMQQYMQIAGGMRQPFAPAIGGNLQQSQNAIVN